jgi:hypothetical protein
VFTKYFYSGKSGRIGWARNVTYIEDINSCKGLYSKGGGRNSLEVLSVGKVIILKRIL